MGRGRARGEDRAAMIRQTPAGTPQEVLDKLCKWVNEITATPATRKVLISQGANPAPGLPGSFKRKVEEAARTWEEVTKRAKIEPQQPPNSERVLPSRQLLST